MPEFTDEGILIDQEDFLEYVEIQLGYCSVQNRAHTFVDFEFDTEQYFVCNECGMKIEEDKWEAGRSFEMFLMGESWVIRKEKNQEDI